MGQHNDDSDHDDECSDNGTDLHEQADDLAALPRQQLPDGLLVRSPLDPWFGERSPRWPRARPTRTPPPYPGSVRPASPPTRHLSHPSTI